MLKANSFFPFFSYSVELRLNPLLVLKNDQVLRWYKTGVFSSNPTKALFACIELYLHENNCWFGRNQTVAFLLHLVVKHTRSWYKNLIKLLIKIFAFLYAFSW